MGEPNNPEFSSEALARKSLLGHETEHTSVSWHDQFPEIIGRSENMREILELVSKYASSPASVLILGESGTGKELIASAIHRLSARQHQKFVAINCNAMSESLIESELFGHQKGSFSGAHANRDGYFRTAHKGTIFLDEIGDMPMHLQTKLLRVLQEKKFTPIGSDKEVDANVRVLAATNVDLEDAILKGRFRADLYYRLHVLPIKLPPLRERKEDIAELLNHFSHISSITHKLKGDCYFSNQALNALCHYQWPGNVRELQNLVERLVVSQGPGKIELNVIPSRYLNQESPSPQKRPEKPAVMQRDNYQVKNERWSAVFQAEEFQSSPPQNELRQTQNSAHLGPKVKLPSEGLNLQCFIEGIENDLILQALVKTSNNKNQAAKLLGLNRTTLVERIKKRKLL